MLFALNKPTLLKCLVHLAMTLLLVVSILLLLSLPTNQMLVPVEKRWEAQDKNSGSANDHTLAHLRALLIFLGLISWSFPTNHKIIVGIWAVISFTVSPMSLLDFQKTKGVMFKFLSFLIHFTPDVHFTDFISIVFKDPILQGVTTSMQKCCEKAQHSQWTSSSLSPGKRGLVFTVLTNSF